jgi:DNA repair exonuclease SbcCD ATPase subunit
VRIDRIRLSGVGGFPKPREIAVGEGLTVIVGSNGSGKTALTWALAAAFTGRGPTDTGYRIPEAAECLVDVALSDGDRSYRLRRDLLAEHVRFTDAGTGESIFEGAAAQGTDGETRFWECLDDAFGTGFVRYWLRTAILTQSAPVEPGLLALREGSAGAQEEIVLSELREEHESLVGGNGDGFGGGQIDLVEEELERKRAARARWASSAAEIEAQAARLAMAEAEWEEAEKAAIERENVYENLARYYDLLRERSRLEEDLKKLREERDVVRGHVEAVEHAEQGLEEEYGEFLNLGVDLEDALQAWTDATARLHENQRRIHLTRQGIAALPRTNTARNGAIVAVGLGVLGWLACLGAGAARLGPLIGPLIGALGYGFVWAKDRGVENLRQSKRAEIEELEMESNEVEDVIAKAKASMGKLGSKGHPMSIRRGIIQYLKAREEAERLRVERDAHPSLHEVVDSYERALEALKSADKETRDLIDKARYLANMNGPEDSLAGEVDMAKSQSEASRARADRLREACEAVRADIRRLDGNADSLGHLERECAEFEERRRFLTRRARALAAAITGLEEASSEFRDGYQTRMAERAGRLLREFTGGRFQAVRFADDRRPEAAAAGGEWVPQSRLSRGVLDQLDLAIRLAGSEEIAGARWPLVLDEIFLLWDQPSLPHAEDMLTGYVRRGGQVVVLSHDPVFTSWGDAVVHLDPRPPRRRSRSREAA